MSREVVLEKLGVVLEVFWKSCWKSFGSLLEALLEVFWKSFGSLVGSPVGSLVGSPVGSPLSRVKKRKSGTSLFESKQASYNASVCACVVLDSHSTSSSFHFYQRHSHFLSV